MVVRALTPGDLPQLRRIDAEFVSDRYLDVVKHADGFNVTWQLIERPLDPPFVSTDYGIPPHEVDELARRLQRDDGLYLVIVDKDRIVAVLDAEHETWRNTALIWNLYVDRAYRGRGFGSDLIARTIQWAADRQLRAIWLETQTNNWPACQFYRKHGFRLCGLDDHFYSNDDIGVKKVALFWWREVTGDD
jgi:ribosomal protein S18 acetylase RimI-like enzyme